MDVFEAIRTVLAVRTFDDRPVPPEVVRRILEAARLTASGANRQPWHFILVEDRAALERLATVTTSGPYVAQAAFAVVVALDDSSLAVSDAGRAVQSMVLTAWEAGVGSNWVGYLDSLEGVKPLLGIPEALGVIAVVPFGYPARALGRGKKQRKPLGEVAHRGRFGVPFE